MHTLGFPIRAAALLPILTLGACVPAALQGEYPSLSPRMAVAAPDAAARVRWGGLILSMDNQPELTCFEVLGQPLDLSARPRGGDADDGRFLACHEGYKDPGVFQPGREITVVGTVVGVEARKVGDYEYRYPRVDAEQVHLWAQRPQAETLYIYDPFPYPYAYYAPYPYYYYPVVYVTPPTRPDVPREAAAPAAAGAKRAAVPLGGRGGGLAPRRR